MSPFGEQCRWMIQMSLATYGLPDSEASVRLLCMIAAHESGGFRYVQQLHGPALSLFQMEPLTYQDVCEYARRKGHLSGELPCPAERMVFDAGFAAAIARIFFLRFRESIPHEDNLTALSEYAKKYWNTSAGKATAELYEKAYWDYFL